MNRLKEISASAGLAICCLALLIAAATIMLACGPAAAPAGGNALPAVQPTPAAGDTLPAEQPVPSDGLNTLPPAQQEGGDSAGESGDDTHTEMPPPPPKPTFTYPNIEDSGLHFEVVDFEEAQKSASGPSGQSDAAVEDSVVLVEIFLSANKAEIAAWLRSKGVTPIYADDADYAHLAAEVPLSLLGALSQQEGVMEVSRPGPTKPGS